MDMNEPAPKKPREEQRAFQQKWELEYFFFSTNGTSTCAVCGKVFQCARESNFKKHYQSHEGQTPSLQNLNSVARKNKFQELKTVQLHRIKNLQPENPRSDTNDDETVS